MGCCGGRGGSAAATTMVAQVSSSNNGAGALQEVSGPGSGKITRLEGFRPDELIWVEYRGARKASFQVAGRRFQVPAYNIQGTGHKFQVHVNDIDVFKRSARGTDYLVGIPDPTLEAEPIISPPMPKVEIREEPREYHAAAPRLATIERLDETAARSRGIPFGEEAPILPAPIPLPQPVQQQPVQQQAIIGAIGWSESDTEPLPPAPMEQIVSQSQTLDLSPLGLPEALREQLEIESWTLEKLATAKEDDLLGYKGIGPKRAQTIIEQARGLVSG